MSVYPRAECRVCGRDSALNADEQIRRHKARTATGLITSGRCLGSSRPPAGEPPCDEDCGRKAGRMCWPEVYDPALPYASTYVCFDPEHQAEAAAWVKSKTGHEGVLVGRQAVARG